jgi:hypothetical protein
VLYSIDITFRNGGIACFGIETDPSDMRVVDCAPIARKIVREENNNIINVISRYLRWGAQIQKLTPQGWMKL